MKVSHINPPTGPQATDSPHPFLEKHTFLKNLKVTFLQIFIYFLFFIFCRDPIEQL